jgi:hypothetical protein
MNFAELQEIIKYMKKAIPCGVCNKKRTLDEIVVLFTCKDEALLHIGCKNCANQVMVHITIIEQNSEKTGINITTSPAKSIEANDILDIHTFLNQFNGDFKQLFTEHN